MASLIKRNGTFYLQWRVGRKIRRRTLGTDSLQLAKDQLRKFESAQLRGVDNPLPTRTPIAEVVAAYVQHIRTVKTAKSAQTDVYYLREMFGPICPEVEITSRKVTPATRKRPRKPGQDRRCRMPVIEAPSFEAITTADVSTFITAHVKSRGLAPKTANRYREIIVRLFNWAMQQRGVRMPGDRNPAAKVERYRESAPEIRYLSLVQIDEQLAALADNPQLQTMVAVLIYAGLRREEMLWLRLGDVELPGDRPGLIHLRAKTINGEFWEPKTKCNRSVPVSTDLRRFLDKYALQPAISGWYFPSPTGSRWDADNFSADLRAVNTHNHLYWTPLHYRHTFGSILAQKGLSLYCISKLMGNSPEICVRHYASLGDALVKTNIDFGMAGQSGTSWTTYER